MFFAKLVPGKHSGPRNRTAFTGQESGSFFFAKLVPGKHSGPRNRTAFSGQESGIFFLLSWFTESILDHVIAVLLLARNPGVFFLFFFAKLVPGKHSGPRNRSAFTGQETGSFFSIAPLARRC